MRLALILICILSFPALAQVYKWKDENGVTHFGSQPPTAETQEVIIRDTSNGRSSAAESDIIRQSRELERRRQNQQLEQAQGQYRSRISEIQDDYDNRPDYVCTGANNRLEEAQERWRNEKRQGYTIDDRQYYEQRIQSLKNSRDNLCR
jgi:DNA polymerase IIIc chi subunit